MRWFLLGVLLSVAYFGFWAYVLGDVDPDDAAIREYERQRAEFERFFE